MKFILLCTLIIDLAHAIPYENTRGFTSVKHKRQISNSSISVHVVDLGYEIYEGYTNTSTGLNVWKGIRYAAPPTGSNRWQPPQTPAINRTDVLSARNFASRCPQAADAPYTGDPCPGLENVVTLPARCRDTTQFQKSIMGNEDCLFLSVYAPQDKTNLPVLVWIHGGGYGAGDGTQDLTRIVNANNNGFVAVAIQYRLGAFGFMSSDEIYRFGTVNAGILDQHFALQWVQSYIHLFGGDASRVTISGESAGGGSVMLQDMAYGGTQGDFLFTNTISASPYLPMQYGYADFVPTQSYFSFAQKVGCFSGVPFGNKSQSIFQCLLGKDTLVLQQASAITASTGTHGTWAFLPVTDGRFIQQLPSEQLLKKQINGRRALIGNNANEGFFFTPQNIISEDDFVNFLRATFPLFSEDEISKVLLYYPSTNASVNPKDPLFATLGNMGPTALNESSDGSGQQQRADNVYGETTFVCPSYWMSEAYAQRTNYASFRYQYSVPPAEHGSDVASYFGPRPPNSSPDFELAFMQIWGNFVMNNNPSLSALTANGQSTGNCSTGNPAANWPQYSSAAPYQMNLNETGGVESKVYYNGPPSFSINVTDIVEPGLKNDFTLVNAYTWEGGRGVRCDFWRAMGVLVPE